MIRRLFSALLLALGDTKDQDIAAANERLDRVLVQLGDLDAAVATIAKLAAVAADPPPSKGIIRTAILASEAKLAEGRRLVAEGEAELREAYDAGYARHVYDATQEATPRDTLTNPKPGDLYVDRDGDTWLCTTGKFLVASPDLIPGTIAAHKLRPATPEEAAKIREDNNL